MRADSIELPAGEAAEDEIELIEMANLSTAQTGVDGVIDISTAQGGHGPRVKWYPGRPSAGGPCLSATIEPEPRVFNHRLPPPAFAAGSAAVPRWVALNHPALLDFWNHGNTWLDDEVTAFKAALKKLG
jgi:hypothetical protein